MYIESLVIEVTRFCNMNCPHCLRGERQRKRFNTNMIENIFADIDYIGTITFTGGEPLTQVNIIIETLDYIEQNNVVTIKQLQSLFPEVSLMTIHRDLDALEKQGWQVPRLPGDAELGGEIAAHFCDDINLYAHM